MKGDYIYINIIVSGMKFRETKDIEIFSELVHKPLQIFILAPDRMDKNAATCIFRRLEARKYKILELLADCPFYEKIPEQDKTPENLFEVDINCTAGTVSIIPNSLLGAVVARLIQFWEQERLLRKGCSIAAGFISGHYVKECAKKVVLDDYDPLSGETKDE